MPNRDGLQGALPARVITLARSWRQLADRVLASLDISNSTGYALLHLERMGPGARQSDLAREIGIAEASLVRTLQQLERSGLVAREPDPEDARAKCLHLTEQGAVLARSIDDRLRSLRGQLLDGISSEDLDTTVAVLDLVARRVGEWRGRP